jgi:Peptidase inhibitor I9
VGRHDGFALSIDTRWRHARHDRVYVGGRQSFARWQGRCRSIRCRATLPAAIGRLHRAGARARKRRQRHVRVPAALKGFAVRLTPGEAAAVAANPRVAYVEPDQVMHADATQSPATWGIDRIDQRDLPLNNTYN